MKLPVTDPTQDAHTIDLRWAGAPATEYSQEFLQGMMNRMIMSHHKYGTVVGARANGIDFCYEMRRRLALYEETGNTEWLMDVANNAMIEFMVPGHPQAHFRATTSEESPGRMTTGGTQTSGHNTETHGKATLTRRQHRHGD